MAEEYIVPQKPDKYRKSKDKGQFNLINSEDLTIPDNEPVMIDDKNKNLRKKTFDRQ